MLTPVYIVQNMFQFAFPKIRRAYSTESVFTLDETDSRVQVDQN